MRQWVQGEYDLWRRGLLSSLRGVSVQPGVDGPEDRADGLLVEPLVSLAALEVFEVTADRAVGEEAGVLVGSDPAEGETAVGASRIDRPSLAGREGLTQEREIGERLHRLDPRLALETLAEALEIELGFEVVHPRLEDRFSVQADPEADRIGPRQVGERLVREVVSGLVGSEVEVGEDHDARRRVFKDLRTPSGVFTGVEPLAKRETEPFEEADQTRGKDVARSGRL